MRASTLVLATSLLLAACTGSAPDVPEAGAPGDALRALEQRLADAEHVAFRATVLQITPQEDWVTQLEARVWLGPSGRARIESAGEVNGLGAAPGLLADGTRMRGGRGGFSGEFSDFDGPVPVTLRDGLAAGFVRRGLAYPLLRFVSGTAPETRMDSEEPGDPGARLTPVNPAWGVPEVIDGRTVRPLSFSLPLDGATEAAVTLWLDAETGLPVRRAQRVVFEHGPYTTDESYTGWSFDALPDSLFVFPRP